MPNLLSTLLLILTFIVACTPEPQYDPERPYQCVNLEQSESKWSCTYKGVELTPEEQKSFNLNIKNGLKK